MGEAGIRRSVNGQASYVGTALNASGLVYATASPRPNCSGICPGYSDLGLTS